MYTPRMDPGPPSQHGLISFKSWSSRSQEKLQQSLDALLNTDATKQTDDELGHSSSGWGLNDIHSKEPVPFESLLDALAIREAGGERRGSSNHRKVSKVPHFKYGIAYLPQEPLVDRSKRRGDGHFLV